jgi:2Fe-2S ferredoxin
MSTIRFRGVGEIDVPLGTTILAAAQELDAPEGSDCGGCCQCSTCHVHVLAGAELLSSQQEEELDTLGLAADVRPSSRLGCQARVVREGRVDVEISEESRATYLFAHPEKRAMRA